MDDTVKFFAHIEAKSKCPKCGNPIYLNGPTAEILCSYCLEEYTINKDIPLDLVLTPFNELNKASGNDISYDCFSYNYTFGQSAPRCPSCKEKLNKKRLIGIGDSDIWNVQCESCGEKIQCGKIPTWIQKKVPSAKIAINALFEIQKVKEEETPKISGIVFSCPKCGGGLDIDGKDRMIKCKFCDSNVYLPDDLWLRLHPVKTVKRWYVGYSEIRFTKIKAKIEPLKKSRSEVKGRLTIIKTELKKLQAEFDELGKFKRSQKKELKEDIFNKDIERVEMEAEIERLDKKIKKIKEKYN